MLLFLDEPIVMGILNITPDSFFDGGKYTETSAIVQRVGEMLNEGATIVDVGAASSRPGAEEVNAQEEMNRLLPAITAILEAHPKAIISVDTYRSSVAKAAVQAGAVIINDISGGRMDSEMFATVADLKVPYILMHMQGTPKNMQDDPHYENVVTDTGKWFSERIAELKATGVKDIILDPGFGFGKTVGHNYRLLQNLDHFKRLFNLPVLAGLSRKSMINKVLGTMPGQALNGTTALNTIALMKGASILRVHDVKEAVEAIRLVAALKNS